MKLVPDITDYKLEFVIQKLKKRIQYRGPNNNNKYIEMKFGTRRFLGSLMLKLEMQKYRKILMWLNYRIFTIMLHCF